MKGQCKRYTSGEKVAILKKHLTSRKPSDSSPFRGGIRRDESSRSTSTTTQGSVSTA